MALLLLVSGFCLRMVDLTDEPLEFQPTRQLRGAIIARGIYYANLPTADPQTRQMAMTYAGKTGQYEPPILETLVAYAYRFVGGEKLWVAGVISSTFWIIGGLALFLLASSMATPTAALISLGYYLFLPFGVQASRSFQPDPGMVMFILLTLLALFNWFQTQKWKWAILAGLSGGMAILFKAMAIYPIALTAIVVVLTVYGFWRFLLKPQVWLMAILMIAPSIVFYLVQNQSRAAEYFNSWTVALSHLLVDPATYIRWLNFSQNLVGLTVIVLAVIGILLSSPKVKTFLLSVFAGYLVYGMTVPYQMYTHNYYHLQLIPILALCLAPLAQLIIERISTQKVIWRGGFVLALLSISAFLAWELIIVFKIEDHRNEPAYWQKIGSLLPTDGKILALTQDYGYRLLYYGWRSVTLWRTSGEQELAELRGWEKEFSDSFSNKIEGTDYFLITAFNQFNSQPQLKETLYNKYPVYAEGNGYLIFDLAHPLTPGNP